MVYVTTRNYRKLSRKIQSFATIDDVQSNVLSQGSDLFWIATIMYLINMKSSKCSACLIVAVSLLGTAACTPTLPGTDGASVAQEVVQYTFSDNAEGLVGGIDFGTGDHLLVYGALNEDDELIRLDAIAMIEADDSFHEIYFDEDVMPIQLRSNGAIWDVTWLSTDEGSFIFTMTIDGETHEFQLAPEAVEVIQILQSELLASSATTREVNRTQAFMGYLQMGLGAGGSVLALASIPVTGAVGGTVLGLAGLGAATATFLNGGWTVAQSERDGPMTPTEEIIDMGFNAISLVSGGRALVGAGTSIARGVAVPLATRLGLFEAAVNATAANESDLFESTRVAQNQACTDNPDCLPSGTVTVVNPCCFTTNNCPSETPYTCPGDCCCCGVGEACLNYVCVVMFSGPQFDQSGASIKPLNSSKVSLDDSGPEIKRARSLSMQE